LLAYLFLILLRRLRILKPRPTPHKPDTPPPSPLSKAHRDMVFRVERRRELRVRTKLDRHGPPLPPVDQPLSDGIRLAKSPSFPRGHQDQDGEIIGMSPLGLLKKERVMMCGLSPPNEPNKTCGIYSTHFHDLYRHRIVHMMWETMILKRADLAGEAVDLSSLIFGGFEADFPKCGRCDKRFARYDSLQRHISRTACMPLSRAEKADTEMRLHRLDRELRKSEALQYWIDTPVPLPKIALVKVAYPSGSKRHRDVVILEIFEVEKTYAPRYQVVTVKSGKEYQIKLFDHDEAGGVEFHHQPDQKVQHKALAQHEWRMEDNRRLNVKQKKIEINLDGRGHVRRVV